MEMENILRRNFVPGTQNVVIKESNDAWKKSGMALTAVSEDSEYFRKIFFVNVKMEEKY